MDSLITLIKMSYEKKAVDLMNRYPAISDLRKKGLNRIPKVSRAYLEQGTDNDETLNLNRSDFSKIRFAPRFLKGELNVSTSTELFDRTYAAPFGVAPVGLMSLMWPNIEVELAKMAKDRNIPFCLSTVATETPEVVGPHVGQNGWFQLYTPREKALAFKILDRAKASGFHTLVITIDIPQPSRRQRTKRAGMSMPLKMTPDLIWQGIKNPTWSLGTLKRGLPALKTIQDYADFNSMMSVGNFVAHQVGGNLSWDYVKALKAYWDGPVLLKGIMHKADALKAVEYGFDGIVVSNHGGRQFDAALSSIAVLPEIVAAVNGQIKVLFDSGIRSGLDIIRALALGADFVLLGRAFVYGVCALGSDGAYHAFQILQEELINNMKQLGVTSLAELRDLERVII